MTLCNPMDCGQLGSSFHGMLQATTLDWVAISFCRGSSRPRDQTCIRRRIPDHWGANWSSIGKNSKTRQWSPGRKSFPKSICQEEGTFCWAGLRSYLPRMLKKLVALLKSGLPWWSRAKELVCQCRGLRSDPWSGKTPRAVEPSLWEAYALHLGRSPHAMKSEKAWRQLRRPNTVPSPKLKSWWNQVLHLLARSTRGLWFVTSEL